MSVLVLDTDIASLSIKGGPATGRNTDPNRPGLSGAGSQVSAESAFWAGILGGHVFKDDDWHSVIDAAGQWRIGVQLAPNHGPPE